MSEEIYAQIGVVYAVAVGLAFVAINLFGMTELLALVVPSSIISIWACREYDKRTQKKGG